MNLYLTADRIGGLGGGATVTAHELAALRTLGDCEVWDRDWLEKNVGVEQDEPWGWDRAAKNKRDWFVRPPKLAHVYAGTFTESIDALQGMGVKVSYTAAAHDVELSRREHEKLGMVYNYPHLTEPDQFERYMGGYRQADVLICPSTHSAEVKRSYGCKQRIEVIPHGVDLPETVAPPPKQFTVGYLGAMGPDKGLIYLLQAWKKLNYRDALLMIGGRDSTHPWVRHLVATHGGGSVALVGWVPNVADFYGKLSLYVQPSVTEGFGLEVLEAMAHGRPVLCSTGAGAADLVPASWRFNPCKPDELAVAIDAVRRKTNLPDDPSANRAAWRILAERYTWDKIEARYAALWKEMLG